MSVEKEYKKLKCSRKLLGRENKNEDMQPIGKVVNGNYILIVADGHGGTFTVNVIKSLSDDICDIASNIGVEDAMAFVKNKCKKIDDGAMITIIKINMTIEEPTIELCWYGDSRAIIYNYNNDIVFQTDTHDLTSNDKLYTSDEIRDMGFDVNYQNLRLIPTINENIFQLEKNKYFKKSNRSISTYGHVGNFGSCVIPPGYKMLQFEKGMKVVAGSDGLWDVIHPESDLIKSTDNANELANIALKRWFGEYDYIDEYNNIIAKGKKMSHIPNDRDDISIIIAANE
jgi:serine/threonine protein phosphatase PrpC